MPTDEKVVERAKEDKEEGKSPNTQAGEFVREEMHHIREGRHGAQSPQQAIAIGLSKARRAGVDLPAPKRSTSAKTRTQARRDTEKGRHGRGRKPSRVRSRATSRALRRKGHSAASRSSLSRHARLAARKRGSRSRHKAAVKGAHTRKKRGTQRGGSFRGTRRGSR
jgi:hypothetical protein